MHIQSYPLGETRQFSPLFLDYASGHHALRPFYGNTPDLEGFKKQIEQKEMSSEARKILVAALERQYAGIANRPDFSILLQPNTYTVTTGHQLNIFTGPLYVIFKMITAINLAKTLKKTFPNKNFIPVYWAATEDHDFAEINHFSLFGKVHTWQTEQKGAVGRMNTAGLEALMAEIEQIPEFFRKAYSQASTLADAARLYIHELFGNEGLICIDADDASLKALFAKYIWAEVLERNTASLVAEQSKQLEAQGYKAQVTARDINFFYVDEQLRERIVYENGSYRVLNTAMSFSEAELQVLLETKPEKFSPNVVLRPVYQEVILPNIAYIGGPGELAYWLQLKSVFETNGVVFPILMPRNFAMIVNKPSAKKMEKLDLTMADLFMDEVSLRKNFVERNSTNALSIAAETKALDTLFDALAAKAIAIDKTLEAAVNSERQKALNSLENLEKRLKKAEERNQETEVSQVLALKQKFFPNGSLQERQDNFLNFYLNNPNFINDLLAHFEPLDFNFQVLTEN